MENSFDEISSEDEKYSYKKTKTNCKTQTLKFDGSRVSPLLANKNNSCGERGFGNDQHSDSNLTDFKKSYTENDFNLKEESDNTHFSFDTPKIPVLGNQVYITNSKSMFSGFLAESKDLHLAELTKV